MTRGHTLTSNMTGAPDTHPPSLRPRTRRVAVVAVHGVADQTRHESARTISRMLTALDDPGAATRYGAFEEKPLTVAVRPVALMPNGRHLWRRDDSDYVDDAIPDGAAASAATPVGRVSEDQDGHRREMCVGAGGHVHYWNPRARSIAEELDRLIRVA